MLNFDNQANRYSENNTATEADAALTAIAKVCTIHLKQRTSGKRRHSALERTS
jgi:hypothetical protein